MSGASPGPGRILRLHFNENTAGCSPAVIDALRALTPENIATYPDVAPFTDRCAQYLGVPADWVHLTNGLDEGIQAAAMWARLGARPGTRPFVIVVEPTFEMYEEFARMVDAGICRLPPEPDFAFPMEALLQALSPAVRVIYLADPNNPTGMGVPAGAIDAIAVAAPQALVFVDEAYADFSGRTLIGPLLERRRNVVIGRTFAKGHGLAGLRIGALVAHRQTISSLRPLFPPFNVNIAALHALDAALADDAYLKWYVAETRESRQRVYRFCERHGLRYWPSEGNFVLMQLGEATARAVEALARQGISLRDKSAAAGCEGCIRLTAGVVAHTDRALSALEDVLAPRTN
jgi:histidinol-phosphate aminotransferase